MANPVLDNYIQTLRDKKIPEDQIKQNLLQAGWKEQDVALALQPASTLPDDLPPPPPPSASGSTSMWDAFQHILLFISLYVLATSISLTLHFLIDYWVPSNSIDMYQASVYADFQNNLLRGYIAAIIVSSPMFSLFFLSVTKKTLQNPQLRFLRSRKILIYLTLVITFILLLSQTIHVIYTFLNGNISINFLLHLSTTIIISGIIFTYYLREVKADHTYAST